MKLLLFNLAMDLDDAVLGFTTRWVEEISRQVETVNVITMRKGRVQVPDTVNVYSVGQEKGYGRSRRCAEFYRHLYTVIYKEKIDACFSHMIPLFTAMSAPILRPLRIPLVTWYAHPSLTKTLKLAHFASSRIVTSLPGTYPYKMDKVKVIGQGIDTDYFRPNDIAPDVPAMVLCVGRVSPVKDHPTLLRAIAHLHGNPNAGDFRVVVLGKPIGQGSEEYFQDLQALSRTLGISEIVDFQPGVSITELASWYRRCTVHVNLTPAGFGDKVALESMSSGRPCLVANSDFRETLGIYKDRLLFQPSNYVQLAVKLGWILAASQHERDEIGHYLRQRTVQLHSVQKLVSTLTKELANLSAYNHPVP